MANLTVTPGPNTASAPSNAAASTSSGAPTNAAGASGSPPSGSAFQAVLDQQKQTDAPSQDPASGSDGSNKAGAANTPAGSDPSRADAASGTKAKDAKTPGATDAAQAASAIQALQAHVLAAAQVPAGAAAAQAQQATPTDRRSPPSSDRNAGTASASTAANGAVTAGPTRVAYGMAPGPSPATQSNNGANSIDAQATPGAQASSAFDLAKGSTLSATAHSSDGTSAVPVFTILHTAAASDPASLAAASAGLSGAPVSIAPPALPSSSISAPLGSESFSSEAASKILYFVQSGVQSAQLHLNPAHLGPLDVQIRMDGNQVNVALASVHPETRHALEASLPQLRHMFGEQGIALGDLSVGARAFSNGSAAEQQAFSGNSGAPARGVSGVSPVRDEGGVAPLVRRSIQLVDTFA